MARSTHEWVIVFLAGGCAMAGCAVGTELDGDALGTGGSTTPPTGGSANGPSDDGSTGGVGAGGNGSGVDSPVQNSGGAGSGGSDGSGGSTSLTVGCGRPRNQVTVGGVEGFDSFVDATHSAQLRACGASLYIHQVGWGGLANDQERRQIAANFLGTGGISLEMAEATNLEADYLSLGIEGIMEILVNAPTCEVPQDSMPVETWRGWVDKWKAKGILRAQYNETPNCHFPVDWNSATWDEARERARIGGGVTLDSPPSFYYDVAPADYRVFVRAQVAWANQNGLHSTWILSPMNTGDFLGQTQKLIAEVNALPADQRPQEWAVQSYGAGGPVGDENVSGSVANVALWVVHNAETYVP